MPLALKVLGSPWKIMSAYILIQYLLRVANPDKLYTLTMRHLIVHVTDPVWWIVDTYICLIIGKQFVFCDISQYFVHNTDATSLPYFFQTGGFKSGYYLYLWHFSPYAIMAHVWSTPRLNNSTFFPIFSCHRQIHLQD